MSKNWRLTPDGKIFRFGRKRYPNGDLYEGEFVDGLREGKGTFTYANGNVYSGSFKNNKFDGFGVFLWAEFAEGNKIVRNRRYEGHWAKGTKSGEGTFILGDGDVYKGLFERDEYHGRGRLAKRDGTEMTGDWKKGQLNGKASIRFSNGDRYEGEFSGGRFQGRGQYIYSKGRGWYEGDYYQGKQHGTGTRVFANTNRYEGSFKFGQMQGEGIMEYANGSQYIGAWESGHPHGRGVMKYPSGEVYEGEFHQGFRFGHGKYTFSDGGYYDGEYIKMKGGYTHGKLFPAPDGKRNGYGVRIWANGDKYEGDWSEDVMHGACVIRKASGGKFEGFHRNGRKCGKCRESWGNMHGIAYRCPMGYKHDGQGFCVYEGYVSDGHFHGQGVFSCIDGHRYQGEWKMGRRHGWGTMVMLPDFERGMEKRMHIGGLDGLYRIVLYEGEWKDGYRTGEGTVEYASGVRLSGILQEGRFEGAVKWSFPDGTVPIWTVQQRTTRGLDRRCS